MKHIRDIVLIIDIEIHSTCNIIRVLPKIINIKSNKINCEKLTIVNNNPYNMREIGVIVMNENESISRKIKILLAYRNMTMADLAGQMHISRSSLSERMKRDRWSLPDLQEIADILDSDIHFAFVMRDTGKEV